MTEMKRILIVDDDDEIRELLEFDISHSGYFVDTASDGKEGLQKALNNSYDLILLDVMMPKMNGFDVCKNIRQAKLSIPILMLTAKGTINDKTIGFDCGADDYLVKPFGVMEMVARVNAVLRRTIKQQSDNVIVGSIILKEKEYKVIVDDKKIELTNKEFEMLKLFMKNPGMVFSRDKLMSEIWGMDYIGETRTVDMHIKTLRQ